MDFKPDAMSFTDFPVALYAEIRASGLANPCGEDGTEKGGGGNDGAENPLVPTPWSAELAEGTSSPQLTRGAKAHKHTAVIDKANNLRIVVPPSIFK
jgi:hypothetical protein